MGGESQLNMEILDQLNGESDVAELVVGSAVKRQASQSEAHATTSHASPKTCAYLDKNGLVPPPPPAPAISSSSFMSPSCVARSSPRGPSSVCETTTFTAPPASASGVRRSVLKKKKLNLAFCGNAPDRTLRADPLGDIDMDLDS